MANKIVNPLRARCCDGGAIYTLGPQPSSTIERNHLINHGYFNGHGRSPYASQPNAVYHDSGSGGFADTQNVIEGNWQHTCGENTPRGCSKCPKHCPDKTSNESNCSISFSFNWFHNITWVQHEQCTHAGAIVHGNVNVGSGPLPPDAQAVVDAAGPRSAH